MTAARYIRLDQLPIVAADLVRHLRDAGWPAEGAETRQALALAEEAGEFVAAYRRYAGLARRSGSREDVCLELADVVITAFVTAAEMGEDLNRWIGVKLDAIYTRGWREQ